MKFNLLVRLTAEFLGSAFLVAAVVGSGIMGERLAGGNVAMKPLANDSTACRLASWGFSVAFRRSDCAVTIDNRRTC